MCVKRVSERVSESESESEGVGANLTDELLIRIEIDDLAIEVCRDRSTQRAIRRDHSFVAHSRCHFE